MTDHADIVREGKPLCWSPERQAYFSIDVVLTRAEAAEAERDEWRDIAPDEIGTPGLFKMYVQAVEDAKDAAEAEVARLRHACDYAFHELGVPQDELTPAPVANAYRVLVAALGEEA